MNNILRQKMNTIWNSYLEYNKKKNHIWENRWLLLRNGCWLQDIYELNLPIWFIIGFSIQLTIFNSWLKYATYKWGSLYPFEALQISHLNLPLTIQYGYWISDNMFRSSHICVGHLISDVEFLNTLGLDAWT
jgi:hypothetical protein